MVQRGETLLFLGRDDEADERRSLARFQALSRGGTSRGFEPARLTDRPGAPEGVAG